MWQRFNRRDEEAPVVEVNRAESPVGHPVIEVHRADSPVERPVTGVQKTYVADPAKFLIDMNPEALRKGPHAMGIATGSSTAETAGAREWPA